MPVFGKIDLPTCAIFLLATLAIASDLAFGKIFNWLTMSMALLAVLYAVVTSGIAGVLPAALGLIAGLVLYGWMFWMGILGGGDVKLLMAFGAWGGIRYTVDVAVLGILLGGVMSAGWIVLKGKAFQFAKKVRRFFLTLFIRELELEHFQFDHSLKMPFGIPIAIAAIWAHFTSPFFHWGLP